MPSAKQAPRQRPGKKGAVAEPPKPAGVAPVSFYGGSAARPQLLKKGDEFVRTGAEAANAPILGESSRGRLARARDRLPAED